MDGSVTISIRNFVGEGIIIGKSKDKKTNWSIKRYTENSRLSNMNYTKPEVS